MIYSIYQQKCNGNRLHYFECIAKTKMQLLFLMLYEDRTEPLN